MMKVLFFWIYKKKIFCYFFEIKAVFKLIIAYIYSKKKIKKKIEYYHLPFVPLFQDIRRTMGRGNPHTGRKSKAKARILPRSISQGRRRCNQEQEKVFHEHAGALFRVDEGGQDRGRGKEASKPPAQFWGRGKKYQGGVVAKNGTECSSPARPPSASRRGPW
jgi:hypothetical protein